MSQVFYSRGRTAIFIAAMACQLHCVQALVELRADVNQANEYGRSPMHVAAAHPNATAIIDVLAEAGTDVNARDKTGLTPIEIADICGFLPNIMMFRAHGVTGKRYETEPPLDFLLNYVLNSSKYDCKTSLSLVLECIAADNTCVHRANE